MTMFTTFANISQTTTIISDVSKDFFFKLIALLEKKRGQEKLFETYISYSYRHFYIQRIILSILKT